MENSKHKKVRVSVKSGSSIVHRYIPKEFEADFKSKWKKYPHEATFEKWLDNKKRTALIQSNEAVRGLVEAVSEYKEIKQEELINRINESKPYAEYLNDKFAPEKTLCERWKETQATSPQENLTGDNKAQESFQLEGIVTPTPSGSFIGRIYTEEAIEKSNTYYQNVRVQHSDFYDGVSDKVKDGEYVTLELPLAKQENANLALNLTEQIQAKRAELRNQYGYIGHNLAFEVIFNNEQTQVIGHKELDYQSLSRKTELTDNSTIYVQYENDKHNRRVLSADQIIILFREQNDSGILVNDNNSEYSRRFIIPIGGVDAEKAKEELAALISDYKTDVNFDETTGEFHKLENYPFSKEYWFPSPDYSKDAEIESIHLDEEASRHYLKEKGFFLDENNNFVKQPTEEEFAAIDTYDGYGRIRFVAIVILVMIAAMVAGFFI